MSGLVRKQPARAAATVARIPAAAALTVAVSWLALIGAGCSNDKHRRDGGPPAAGVLARAAHSPRPGARAGAIVLTRGLGVGSVAADRRHLVWAVGPSDVTSQNTTLRQGDIRTRKTVTLARGVRMGYGLASTADWVVYPAGVPPVLKAVRHDGSHTRVLSRGPLLAPPASRGERVAWAQQNGDRLQVIVRDMSHGKEWVAADMPRCRGARCYRIDAVTLADRGVVFDRGAIGPQPSAIIRRAFTRTRPDRLVLKRVTQPRLAPSSAGALYYAIGHGWQRWDFGKQRPRRTPYSGSHPAPVVAYEHGSWLLVPRHGCESELLARLPDGRRRVLASPSGVGGLPTRQYSACHILGGVGWLGRQPLSAWAVIPAASVEAKSNRGLSGAVLATPLP